MIIKERELIERACELIRSCDADTLAQIIGDIFGGKCTPVPLKDNDSFSTWSNPPYEFIPNDYYEGAFDYLEEKKK